MLMGQGFDISWRLGKRNHLTKNPSEMEGAFFTMEGFSVVVVYQSLDQIA